MSTKKFIPEPYTPPLLPIDVGGLVLGDIEMVKLMVEAGKAVGEYCGFLINTPNPWLLISPLVNQEAVLSSKLEGTHATLEDVLNYEAGNEVGIEKDELMEIVNYREALFYALNEISQIDDTSESGKKKLPLTSRVIKEMHKILLNNVRGAKKKPGIFKTEQNYITGIGGIVFTPLPAHLTDEYMSNLEKYIHQDEIDSHIQAALIHAQFEMIHPFNDGNGRMGRLLIPLFLFYRNILPLPTFYMSEYFNQNRDLYLETLANVSKNRDYKTWINYFLKGVIFQAEHNTLKARQLLELYSDMKTQCLSEINSRYAVSLLDEIFMRPIFRASQMIEKIGAAPNTVYTLLNDFEACGIIKKNDLTRRNVTYVCEKILSITK